MARWRHSITNSTIPKCAPLSSLLGQELLPKTFTRPDNATENYAPTCSDNYAISLVNRTGSVTNKILFSREGGGRKTLAFARTYLGLGEPAAESPRRAKMLAPGSVGLAGPILPYPCAQPTRFAPG